MQIKISYVDYIGNEIYVALDYRFNRTKESSQAIKDVYDSKIYNNFIASRISNDKHTVSFKHNTDGIADVFNSSRKDVWPVFLQINKLPPLKKPENMIIAGLWFGGHPNMNTFTDPIKNELKCLHCCSDYLLPSMYRC